MKETLLNIKNQITRRFAGRKETGTEEGSTEDYVELGPDIDERNRAKVAVRQFIMESFEDIKPILDGLRQGNIIALINIQPLKEKDIVELKRAVNKLKKTCDAIDGDIAGFGEDYIVATPEFAYVQRGGSMTDKPAGVGE